MDSERGEREKEGREEDNGEKRKDKAKEERAGGKRADEACVCPRQDKRRRNRWQLPTALTAQTRTQAKERRAVKKQRTAESDTFRRKEEQKDTQGGSSNQL